jgi:hypothetical protein
MEAASSPAMTDDKRSMTNDKRSRFDPRAYACHGFSFPAECDNVTRGPHKSGDEFEWNLRAG